MFGKSCTRFDSSLMQQAIENQGYLSRKEWWNCVAYLNILLRPVPLEKVVVGKGLEARRLTNRQTSTLSRVGVNEIMSVLRDMACDRA